jgi:dCMP deaminase
MSDHNPLFDQCLSYINSYYAKKPRPTWDEYFLSLAFHISVRSEDPDIKHGAVLVNEYNQIIGTGYNGPVKGSDNSVIPFNIRDEKRKWMIHAEENCILNTTQNPSERRNNCVMYVTGQPCNNCLQRIINFGVKKIIVADRMGSITDNEQTEQMRKQLMAMSGLQIHRISTTNEWIKKCMIGVL